MIFTHRTRYPAVIIISWAENFAFKNHCFPVAEKASSIIAQTFPKTKLQYFTLLFGTYLRSLLEYSNFRTISRITKNTELVEKVQWKAIQMCCGMHNLSRLNIYLEPFRANQFL